MKKTSICYSKTDTQNYHTRSPIWPFSFFLLFFLHILAKQQAFHVQDGSQIPTKTSTTLPQHPGGVCTPSTSAPTLATETSATRSFLLGTQTPA